MEAFDTSSEIKEIQIEVLKKMSPEKRLNIAIQLSEIAKKLLMEGIRTRHPEYKKEDVKLALIRILLGDEQFEMVYPQWKGITP